MATKTIKIEDIIDGKEKSPLPLSVIPNHMGINLCSVESISYTKLKDNQLKNLTINFIPEK